MLGWRSELEQEAEEEGRRSATKPQRCYLNTINRGGICRVPSRAWNIFQSVVTSNILFLSAIKTHLGQKVERFRGGNCNVGPGSNRCSMPNPTKNPHSRPHRNFNNIILCNYCTENIELCTVFASVYPCRQLILFIKVHTFYIVALKLFFWNLRSPIFSVVSFIFYTCFVSDFLKYILSFKPIYHSIIVEVEGNSISAHLYVYNRVNYN